MKKRRKAKANDVMSSPRKVLLPEGFFKNYLLEADRRVPVC